MNNLIKKMLFSATTFLVLIFIFQIIRMNYIPFNLYGNNYCWFERTHKGGVNYNITLLNDKFIYPNIISDLNHIYGGFGLSRYRMNPPHFGFIVPTGIDGVKPRFMAWSYKAATFWGESNPVLLQFNSNELERKCVQLIRSRQ